MDVRPWLHDANPAAEAIAEVTAYCDFKRRIAERLQPRSILEIGVGSGHAAAAFLTACPSARYVGLDADNGQHGGIVGRYRQAEQVLRRCFPEAEIEVHQWDTQRDPPSPDRLGRFALVHVDGDHTEQGCYRDLLSACQLAPLVLVDDFLHLEEVQRAVLTFLLDTQHPAEFHRSFRGDVLILLR